MSSPNTQRLKCSRTPAFPAQAIASGARAILDSDGGRVLSTATVEVLLYGLGLWRGGTTLDLARRLADLPGGPPTPPRKF